MQGKKLYIISEAYPYGNGEQFFEKEVLELSRYFNKIIIFPLNVRGEKRTVPENVHVDTALAFASRRITKRSVLKNIFLLITIFFTEFIYTKKKIYFLKNIRTLLNSCVQSQQLSEILETKIDRTGGANYFYSFWMNDGALILSILKKQGKIPKFLFRVNGFDLFEERREGGYMPFRFFNYKHADQVVVLSQAGMDYLKGKKYAEKLFLNYYGIYDEGFNELTDPSAFTMVSCSSMIPLKRVGRIVEVLKRIDFPLTWIHLGDGPLMQTIQLQAKDLPAFVQYQFRGNVSNTTILELYKKQQVNLFIHLSETEGLGLAIIEAQSFGIPALATGVGGVVNVVNEQTGVRIEPDCSIEEISNQLKRFRNGLKNSKEYRVTVKEYWKNNFNAEKNYELLAKAMLQA